MITSSTSPVSHRLCSGLLDDDGAHLRSGQRGQASAELTDCRSYSTYNNNFTHFQTIPSSFEIEAFNDNRGGSGMR